mgnify:CR=1 FL=1
MDLSEYKEIILYSFIIVIVLINLVLFSSFKKKKSNSSFEIIKKTTHMMRDPFKNENEKLEKLSRMVNDFKKEEDINIEANK